MPIYAYKCESCGHAKDVLQKISAEPLTDCPACGAATFKKQLTAAGFQLKGSGWYVTDFRIGGSRAAATRAGAPRTTAAPPPPPPGAAAPSPPAATTSPAPAAPAPAPDSGATASSSAPAACGAACGCH